MELCVPRCISLLICPWTILLDRSSDNHRTKKNIHVIVLWRVFLAQKIFLIASIFMWYLMLSPFICPVVFNVSQYTLLSGNQTITLRPIIVKANCFPLEKHGLRVGTAIILVFWYLFALPIILGWGLWILDTTNGSAKIKTNWCYSFALGGFAYVFIVMGFFFLVFGNFLKCCLEFPSEPSIWFGAFMLFGLIFTILQVMLIINHVESPQNEVVNL
jgi:hypothetical protein